MSLLPSLVLLVSLQGTSPAADPIRVYLGPLPGSDAASPIPRTFRASYADLRRVHGKQARLYRNAPSVPALTLVDEPARADLVLTVVHRGPCERHGGAKALPTLIARLTVRRAGDNVDLSGVGKGQQGRTRWTQQAERIYAQAAAFADTHYAALIRMRALR